MNTWEDTYIQPIFVLETQLQQRALNTVTS